MTIARSLLRFTARPSRTAQREELISRLSARVLALREELDGERGRVAELEEIVELLEQEQPRRVPPQRRAGPFGHFPPPPGAW